MSTCVSSPGQRPHEEELMEEAVGPCSCAGRGRGMMQGHSRGRWFLKAAHIEIVNKPHTHSHTAFTNTHTRMHSREGTILYYPNDHHCTFYPRATERGSDLSKAQAKAKSAGGRQGGSLVSPQTLSLSCCRSCLKTLCQLHCQLTAGTSPHGKHQRCDSWVRQGKKTSLQGPGSLAP